MSPHALTLQLTKEECIKWLAASLKNNVNVEEIAAVMINLLDRSENDLKFLLMAAQNGLEPLKYNVGDRVNIDIHATVYWNLDEASMMQQGLLKKVNDVEYIEGIIIETNPYSPSPYKLKYKAICNNAEVKEYTCDAMANYILGYVEIIPSEENLGNNVGNKSTTPTSYQDDLPF